MSLGTKRVVEALHELMDNRAEPFPLRDLYHEVTNVRGIHVGGKDPINNLSAILYRYGFEAVGRTGWRVLRDVVDNNTAAAEPEPEPDLIDQCSSHMSNGLAHEAHGAATH